MSSISQQACLSLQTDRAAFSAAKGGANRLLTGIPTSSGWLMEALLTFLLVFVVFTATDQARAQSTAHLPILAPAGIGFAVFVCHLAAVALDGCSINRKLLHSTQHALGDSLLCDILLRSCLCGHQASYGNVIAEYVTRHHDSNYAAVQVAASHAVGDQLKRLSRGPQQVVSLPCLLPLCNCYIIVYIHMYCQGNF